MIFQDVMQHESSKGKTVKASRAKLRAIARQMLRMPGWPIGPISLDEFECLWDEVEGVIVEDTLPILLSVANDDVGEVRQRWGSGAGMPFVNWSDEELKDFRDQLRKIWFVAEQLNLANRASRPDKRPDLSQLEPIWKEWFKLDSDAGWFVEPLVGKLIPRPENIRGIAGRTLIHNSTRLASCSNPPCGRLFLQARSDQTFCLEKACLRYGNKMRNREWRASKSKLTRATRPKKGRQL